MSSRIKINNVFRLLRFVITTYHIKVQIAFDSRDERASLHKIFGAKQPFFFSVPKCEDYISFRLLSTGNKCPYYLQYSGYTGCIIVGSVINLVSVESWIYAQMVKMSAYDYILFCIFTGNHA